MTNYYPFGYPNYATLNTWIVVKFVCRDYLQYCACNLQLRIDTTNGLNGGTWTKVNEVDDLPGMGTLDDNNNPTKCPATYYGWCGDPGVAGSHPPGTDGRTWWMNPISLSHGFQGANYSVMMRNDSTTEQYFKYMSIREVDPINALLQVFYQR